MGSGIGVVCKRTARHIEQQVGSFEQSKLGCRRVFVGMRERRVRIVVMDCAILIVMVQLVRALGLMGRAGHCQRLQPSNLRSGALQMQTNEQKEAEESAHGEDSQKRS